MNQDPFLPSRAIHYLERAGFVSKGYHRFDESESWWFSTPYLELPVGAPIPSNLAYYGEGTERRVLQLQLVLNVNGSSHGHVEHQRLAEAASALVREAFGVELDDLVRGRIRSGEPCEGLAAGNRLRLEREDWSNGQGYELRFAISARSRHEFDVGLSFAGEDREYVEQVGGAIKQSGYRVFYADDFSSEMWGASLPEYLQRVYRDQCRYVLVFISRHYAAKAYPRQELRSALERKFRDNDEVVLPVRLDDTDVPGLPSTTAYLDARVLGPAQIADHLAAKLDSEDLQ